MSEVGLHLCDTAPVTVRENLAATYRATADEWYKSENSWREIAQEASNSGNTEYQIFATRQAEQSHQFAQEDLREALRLEAA